MQTRVQQQRATSRPVSSRQGGVAVHGQFSVARPQRAHSVVCHAGKSPRLPLLVTLSRALEVQGLTTKYEVLAGRSAMLGTATAIVVEALTEQSLLQSSLDTPHFLGMAAAVMLVASLCATLQSAPTTSPVLLEPVITSLTAVKRSGSSLTATNSNVDKAVDDLLLSTFTPERLRDLTDYQADV